MNIVVLFESDDDAEKMLWEMGAPLGALEEEGAINVIVDNAHYSIDIDTDTGLWALFSALGAHGAVRHLYRTYPDSPSIRNLMASHMALCLEKELHDPVAR